MVTGASCRHRVPICRARIRRSLALADIRLRPHAVAAKPLQSTPMNDIPQRGPLRAADPRAAMSHPDHGMQRHPVAAIRFR